MERGFTLTELLVVIGVLTVLTSIVIVAINPGKHLQDSRNAKRRSDVEQILNGIYQCIVDKKAKEPCIGSLASDETYEIVTDTSGDCQSSCPLATSQVHCADLDELLTDYLFEFPVDPGDVTTGHTKYAITAYANNIISIQSCSPEGGAEIKFAR